MWSCLPAFLRHLFCALESDQFPDAACWVARLRRGDSSRKAHVRAQLSRGRYLALMHSAPSDAFVIIDAQLFVDQVLPVVGRTSVLRSFYRQLSHYGFKRVTGAPVPVFEHPRFRPGMPHLLFKLHLTVETARRARKQSRELAGSVEGGSDEEGAGFEGEAAPAVVEELVADAPRAESGYIRTHEVGLVAGVDAAHLRPEADGRHALGANQHSCSGSDIDTSAARPPVGRPGRMSRSTSMVPAADIASASLFAHGAPPGQGATAWWAAEAATGYASAREGSEGAFAVPQLEGSHAPGEAALDAARDARCGAHISGGDECDALWPEQPTHTAFFEDLRALSQLFPDLLPAFSAPFSDAATQPGVLAPISGDRGAGFV